MNLATPSNVSVADNPVECDPGKARSTILLVEDDELLREFMTVSLESQGIEILAAATAEAALGIWEERAAEIDLLLTDIMLPGELMGTDLAFRLKESRPELKVICTSGYVREGLRTALRLPDDLLFLCKPFTAEALIKMVREVLIPA